MTKRRNIHDLCGEEVQATFQTDDGRTYSGHVWIGEISTSLREGREWTMSVNGWDKLDVAKEEAMNEWISVEDRLPEIDKQVLVMLGDNKPPCEGVMIGRRHCGTCLNWTVTNSYGSALQTGKVSHWMPLPEPPKEEGPFHARCDKSDRLPRICYKDGESIFRVFSKSRAQEIRDDLNELWAARTE